MNLDLSVVTIRAEGSHEKKNKYDILAGKAPLMHGDRIFLDNTVYDGASKLFHVPDDPADVKYSIYYNGELDVTFTGAAKEAKGTHFILANTTKDKLGKSNGMACIVRLVGGSQGGQNKVKIVSSVPVNGELLTDTIEFPRVD